MENLQENNFLKYNPDTLVAVRKLYGLENPEDMNRAIDILEEWVKQQDHFIKKDFSRRYLEASIVLAKGSLQKAKTRMDHLCTFKILLPQYFGAFDYRNELRDINDFMTVAVLPRLTKTNERILIVKLKGNKFESAWCLIIAKFFYTLCEYMKVNDYSSGTYIVSDYKDFNLTSLLSKLNLVVLRQAASIILDGFGTRVKGKYFISSSKLIDFVLKIFKQVVSPKVGERFHACKDFDSMVNILQIPKELLPKDYGGEEKTLLELSNELIDTLNSKDHLEYLEEMRRAGIDESRRPVTEFNEQYMGTPGTFRTLTVD